MRMGVISALAFPMRGCRWKWSEIRKRTLRIHQLFFFLVAILCVGAVICHTTGVFTLLFGYKIPDLPFSTDNKIPNFTIVTAFFNLGAFQKHVSIFTPELYKGWATVFGRMHNNLVVYTDDFAFKELIESRRRELKAHTSVVFLQNRSSLWAFQLRPQIQTIFADPTYPKHYPNTVLADYPCAQHAKYELIVRTIHDRKFPGTHYAWLDVGYFRDIVNMDFNFLLQVPGDFDDNKIAYTKIADASLKVEPMELIKQNCLWIGGGMFIGTPEVLLAYFEQYKRAVHVFLSESLMNSDQQMVYGMFTDTGRQKIKPTVEVQLYTPKGPGNPWFYLGFFCARKLDQTVV